jgi:hypothetical protein
MKHMHVGKKMNLTPSKGGTKHPMETSAKVHSPAGSGSRPVPSKHKIMVSAPAHSQKLDSRSKHVKVMK